MANTIDLDVKNSVQELNLSLERADKEIALTIEGASGGTLDYELLYNKPSIESVELKGDKTFKELGLDIVSIQEIDKMIYGG